MNALTTLQRGLNVPFFIDINILHFPLRTIIIVQIYFRGIL